MTTTTTTTTTYVADAASVAAANAFGTVSALDASGVVRTRKGKFAAGTGFAVTAVIPGKGTARQTGAVIAFYASYDKAATDAATINSGSVPGWSDARVVPAVNSGADKDATRQLLWYHLCNVALWLAAKAAHDASQRQDAPQRGQRRGPRPGPRGQRSA